MRRLGENLEETDLEHLGSKARNLHLLKLGGFPVPPGVVLFEEKDEIDVNTIGGFPVAVRSSGSLEDLENASFAGLYDTFLFIGDEDSLRKAIAECFASTSSERVRSYLENKNIKLDQQDLKMSVLVQQMVKAKIAGVLFTLNPVTGREEEMYLELCEGVGERLVSGHVTPSRIVYNWLADEKVSEVVNEERTVIKDFTLKKLIHLASGIQAYFGCPQDIEWAIGEDDSVYILQSRPITTVISRTDRPELTNADFKDGGVSARVCTQLMYSVYREALRYSMGDYFKRIHLIPNDEKIQWIFYHYGRVYWNAEAVKEGLKKIPDFKEEDFDRDLGVQKEYGLSGPSVTPVTVSNLVEAIPVLLGLKREYLDCLNMIDLFRERFEKRDQELKATIDLASIRDVEFRDWFLKVITLQNETEKNYFRTIYNNSNFQSEFRSFLKKNPRYHAGDEIDLMSELHGVSHLDVQSGLQRLRRAADSYGFNSRAYWLERENFLAQHYHHGPAELDLTVARWGERKDWVDDLVENFIPSVPTSKSKFGETYSRLTEGLGSLGRRRFSVQMEKSRQFLRLREEMRSYSTRAYFLLRMGLLEFSRRYALEGDDIFMLDILEIRDLLWSRMHITPDLEKRRLLYRGYRSFRAPNEFGGSIAPVKIKSGSLVGLGCSPGEMTGRARVILDIHKTHSLNKNEILVTLFTDPGWTPVLARVGGVVTEVGGLLSHAAVIGREYGIPAVLNLIDATKIIGDGDLIRINGKTGVVEILEKSS